MQYDVREDKINELVALSQMSGRIDRRLYAEYDVKQGLRDSAGKGVLTGLTEISDVIGMETNEKGRTVPAEGQLYYQGYNIRDLVSGFTKRRYGFEEITYLLLCGRLPSAEELEDFSGFPEQIKMF